MNIDPPAVEDRETKFRPGVHVKNGKLYAFSERSSLVVRGWPELSAWRKTSQCPGCWWFMPKIDFLQGIIYIGLDRHEPVAAGPGTVEMAKAREIFEREKQIIRDFFGNVPRAVQSAIAPFESREWELHLLAARCPGSLDLIATNPALAYCLTDCLRFAPYSPGYALRVKRRLIGCRRREICWTLGFPNTESSVAILAKIPASECEIPMLLKIRELMDDPNWRKTLSHLPSLNKHVLKFLTEEALRCRTTSSLLHELCACSGEVYREALWLMNMQKEVGGLGPERFESLRQIFRLKACLAKAGPVINHVDLPKPPIPGNESVIALENSQLLFREALAQHNCAISYVGGISEGLAYLYRVLEPERATLSIVPDGNGGWQIGELLRAQNEPVSEATHRAVVRWLRAGIKSHAG